METHHTLLPPGRHSAPPDPWNCFPFRLAEQSHGHAPGTLAGQPGDSARQAKLCFTWAIIQMGTQQRTADYVLEQPLSLTMAGEWTFDWLAAVGRGGG